jgi:hypothetical protein
VITFCTNQGSIFVLVQQGGIKMADLISIVVGPVSLLLGIAVSEFRQWRQEKEKYKTLTFEKRLTAHQEAFKLTNELREDFTFIFTGEGTPTDEVFYKDIGQLKIWWKGNCLWLDPASRKILFDLGNEAQSFVESHDQKDAETSIDVAYRAEKILTEGIGQEYFRDTHPRIKRPQKTG